MTPSYLRLVHPDQALVDFGPGRNSADVPQLVGVFGKRTRLHLQKKRQNGGGKKNQDTNNSETCLRKLERKKTT